VAEASTMRWVVGVHATLHELASVERVVVGVSGRLGAGGAVAVGCGALAHRMLGKDSTLEPGVVPVVVAALPCCAAALLCLAGAGRASSGLDWLATSCAGPECARHGSGYGRWRGPFSHTMSAGSRSGSSSALSSQWLSVDSHSGCE
jgi:hypothetical protein